MSITQSWIVITILLLIANKTIAKVTFIALAQIKILFGVVLTIGVQTTIVENITTGWFCDTFGNTIALVAGFARAIVRLVLVVVEAFSVFYTCATSATACELYAVVL